MQDRLLNEHDMALEPFGQFSVWFEEAEGVVDQPEAMALATADGDGAPSVRMVLLKSWDERGFVFFTNYSGVKGAELTVNPRAALALYWHPLHRQVRAKGLVERVSQEESDQYFASRPRPSQLAAHGSPQSAVLSSRAELDARVAECERRFEGAAVPRPRNWGGYRLVPSGIEFWQHRENRLHDRLVYQRHGQRWVLARLGP